MDFKKYVAKKIHEVTDLSLKDIESLIEIPPDSKLGDYAFPCFVLSKKLKQSPSNIAISLKDELTKKNIEEDHKYFELIINNGPYVNFFVNKKFFMESILKEIINKKQDFGKKEKNNQIVLIESPGPNTNKPLHLGHLRNILLGQSLANILRVNGYEVYIVNIINDRGVHICKSMLAYKKLGSNDSPEVSNLKPDHFVGKYYVKYSELEKSDPSAEEEVREMLRKWEANDEETVSLWRKMNNWALQGFYETYKKLDFTIDKEYYESEIYLKGKEIIYDGLKKGLFRENETGIIVDLEHLGLGKKVLLRKDGTSVYITQDIYLAFKRYNDFKFNKMYYVVGNEQEHHFKVLFEVFKILGWNFYSDCFHFSYGMVELPEGKMKSREGNVIDTDDLIEKVNSLALQELKKRYPELNLNELNKRAYNIALSAIRFFFLKYDPVKNFVFNINESLSFEGETGPYIQYCNARINSIFKKAGYNLSEFERKIVSNTVHFLNKHIEFLNTDIEFELVKILSKYPEILYKAANEMKPSLLCRYLLDLSQKFNEFYHNNAVISENHELMNARLLLIYSVQNILKSGMNILNIVPIEEM
ncbi:MAG: arginine--tRNA ligase [Candidatus Woesearchaeota archaeon]